MTATGAMTAVFADARNEAVWRNRPAMATVALLLSVSGLLAMILVSSSFDSTPGTLELLSLPSGIAQKESGIRAATSASAAPEAQFAASQNGIRREFEDSYRRGELSSSSLIHINMPIRKWRFGFKSGDKISPQAQALKLTPLEAATKSMMEKDAGGLQRVKASGNHMANRINSIMTSLQNKLDTAATARKKFVHTNMPLGKNTDLVTPEKDRAWDREMRMLDKTIRDHGGVPKPHRRHRWLRYTDEEEAKFQDSLRKALGHKPTGMGVF